MQDATSRQRFELTSFLHGRTRACAFIGDVEYDTIAEVKSRVSIPVVANGNIDSPEKAREVLRRTGADALMIGRAAQGRPWIFREIQHYLASGSHLPAPRITEIRGVLARRGNPTGLANRVRSCRLEVPHRVAHGPLLPAAQGDAI